jgi:predicted esterase
MKRSLLTATLSFFSMIQMAKAQCPAGRYLTDMFDVSVSTVTYSTPYNLEMDIYQPVGDVQATRPLIILAHGGSFVGGSKTDDVSVDTLCVRFARRGYVTASINYRLGNALSMALDSMNAITVVMKAVGDGKAAIRYFVKDAATTNTYKIDTNNIFCGGNSAGAVLYMHVGYLDSAEAPAHVAGVLAANGGFEGNSGNAGYTTKTKAVINLAGALNLPSFIDATDVPSVNVHGDADDVVPYNCNKALGGLIDVNLCGLGTLEGALTGNSIYHWSKVYAGDAHVPWNSDQTKLNTVDSLVKEFLYTLVCPVGASVNGAANVHTSSINPNPTHGDFRVTSSGKIEAIAVRDITGRIILSRANIRMNEINIDANDLNAGMYFVTILFADGMPAETIKLSVQ